VIPVKEKVAEEFLYLAGLEPFYYLLLVTPNAEFPKQLNT